MQNNTIIEIDGLIPFPATLSFHFPVHDKSFLLYKLLSSDRIRGLSISEAGTQKHREKMKARGGDGQCCQLVMASHFPATCFNALPQCVRPHFLASMALKVKLPTRLACKVQHSLRFTHLRAQTAPAGSSPRMDALLSGSSYSTA